MILERSIDPDTLNWESDVNTRLSWKDIIKYALGLWCICPLVCFYLNYRFYLSDVSLLSIKQPSMTIKAWHNLCLVATIIWDQIVYTLISVAFNKSKFVNLRRMYQFRFSFNCIYGLFSGILMPNLALQQVFMVKRKALMHLDKDLLIVYVISGFKLNCIILIISGAFFKIVQPFFVAMFTKIKKYFKTNKKQDTYHPTNSTLFSEVNQIKTRAIETQQKQIEENNSLIYSLSFANDCVISISFYGLLVPIVIFYILPAFLCSLIIDYYRFTTITKTNLILKIRQLKLKYAMKGFNKKIKISSNRNHQLARKLLLLKKQKFIRVQKIPNTIFVNFLTVLIIMTLPFSLFGYYGLAKQFEIFLSIRTQSKGAHKIIKNIGKMSHFISKNIYHSLLLNKKDRLFLFVMIDNINMLISTTIESIRVRPKVQLIIIFYILFIIVYRFFYKSESFINRTQNRVWKNKKDFQGSYIGNSFKEINPAYWI